MFHHFLPFVGHKLEAHPLPLPRLAVVVDADSRLTPRSAMADIRTQPAAILCLAQRQIQGPWRWLEGGCEAMRFMD